MSIDKISANAAGAANAASSKKTDSNSPAANADARDPSPQGRDPKMLEAARSFENQFIRQMISEMRKTVPQDELLGNSMADDIFRDQLDDKYADQWVDQGGIGLADMIYNQLYEKYGPQAHQQQHGKAPGEFLRVPQGAGATSSGTPGRQVLKNGPRDILSQADKSLFLMKMSQNGFTMKSKEPLPEQVGLRSPFSGTVLQAASLDDGRQMVVVRHDQGLISRFVHTGVNRVKNDMAVSAGEIIAELPASQKGESANVVFELRQASKPE